MSLFETWGIGYDVALWPAERLGLRAMRQRLLDGVGGRVLEVGVGTGLNLPLYSADAPVVGIDPAWPMLVRAAQRQRLGQHLVQADVQALPFPDETFDWVVGTLVFCSVPDVVQGLTEVHRVLRPGGRVRLLEHVRGHTRLTRFLTDTLDPLWYGLNGACHLNRDPARLFPEAGLKVVRREAHLGTLVEVIEAVR